MPRPYPSLRQGLVGAWCPSLGASGLTLIDRSGRNNHGTLTNMAGQDNWRASGSGLSLNFDGTNDRVTTALVPTTSRNISYSTWVYPRRLNAYQGIFSTFTSNSQSFELFVDATGSRFVVVNFANSTFTVPATVNAWQHLAVSINGTAAVSYLNGAAVASATIAAPGASTSAFVIGQRSSGATPYPYNGLIDDLRLLNRTLTAPEVRLLASRRGIGLPTPPLFDEDSDLQQYPIDSPPNRVHANVDGVWVPGQVRANEAGTWGNGEMRVNQGGEWL